MMKSSVAKMLVFWGSIICLSPPACNKWGQRDLSMQQVGPKGPKYATSGPKDHINTLGGGPSKVSFFCRHRDPPCNSLTLTAQTVLCSMAPKSPLLSVNLSYILQWFSIWSSRPSQCCVFFILGTNFVVFNHNGIGIVF